MRSDSNRQDFSTGTKRTLAERVGFRCSFPGCKAVTIGPSEEGPESVSSTGMACHIVAASAGQGARRTNINLTEEEIRSAENGIWMCYRHGKLIDTDEIRFTVEALHRWKEVAEFRAQLSQEAGHDIEFDVGRFSHRKLVEHEVGMSGLGRENVLIGDALVSCGVAEAWGDEIAEATRDFLVEVTRNSFNHGLATAVTLRVEANKIELEYDGNDFNPLQLLAAQTVTGGVVVIKHLIEKHGAELYLDYKKSEPNVLTVACITTASDLVELTPCVMTISGEDMRGKSLPFKSFHSCETLYLLLADYFCFSDARMLYNYINALNSQGFNLVIVGRQVSGLVLGWLEETNTTVRVIRLKG